MKYAKLVNEYPQYAPNYVIDGDNRHINPSAAQYMAAGYLPVYTTDPPTRDGYHAVCAWVEEPNVAIRQEWTLEADEPVESTVEISREDFDLIEVQDGNTEYHVVESDNTITIYKGAD